MTDIVERLRAAAAAAPSPALLREAADEIERLRADCDACIAEIHEIDPDRPGVSTHRDTYQHGYSHGISDAEEAVKRRRKKR